jgi:WD40 repeat protein
VDISADGAFVVVADAAGLVVIDGQTAAVRERLTFDGVERITDIAISPDDRLIAAGDLGGRVVVFDLPTGRRLGTLRGHSERIAALEFASPNLLVSGSWDDSVRLWDLDVLSAERSALVAELRETWGVPISEVLGGH